MQVSLPREFNQKSAFKASLGILFAISLLFGNGALLYALLKTEMSLVPKALFSLPLLVMAGYGMLLLGFMGHDGTHFTLHEDRVVSSVLGILLTAPVFPYLVMGFTISHWNHHKFTNTDKDPDSVLFSKFKNLFSRSLLARPYSFYEYGRNTILLALGKPLPFSYQFPLSENTVRKLAQFNILISLSFGAFWAVMASRDVVFLTVLLGVYLLGTVISGLSPFIEHTGTGLGRGVDTRTADGKWWDFFILGNNYHLEHHLFPTVPFYNLRKAHRHLRELGYYSPEKPLSHGPLDTYQYALSKYAYPFFPSKG